MGTTTFSGPVRSENGFQSVTKNDATGAVTVSSDFGTNTEIAGTLEVTGATTVVALTASGAVIFSGLPTSDPSVAGQLFSDAGVLTVSAG